MRRLIFAKGMRSFCSRNGVRLEFISNENDDIFEEDNEEPQIEEKRRPSSRTRRIFASSICKEQRESDEIFRY